jgi:GNAT superfamily N-acetyltransferase
MPRRADVPPAAGDDALLLRAEHRPGREDERRVTAHAGAGPPVGEIRFQVCRCCGTGRVRSLWVDEMWRGEGIGLGLLRAAVAALPGFRWTTTLQSRAGRGFFAASGPRLGVPLPAGGPLCRHLTGRMERLWRRPDGGTKARP